MSVIPFAPHGPQAYFYPTRAHQLDANWQNQRQQQQQQQQQQQPLSPQAVYGYPQAGYYPTQISPPVQQQQQQQQQTQFAALRPSDQGYDSDSHETLLQQQLYSYHFQPRFPAQPQPQQLRLQLAASASSTTAKQASPGSSTTCDSARAESPADAQLAEVTSDLEGLSLTGQRHVDMALSQTMEVVWHHRFYQFFRQFATDNWYLIPVFDQPDACQAGIGRAQSWRYFKDQAKVRFICTSCQKAWTSMGGQVVFWIFRDAARNIGCVYFKLYGQKCTDCSPEYYEHAIWYQEEVEKVVENLYQHVGQVFYGCEAQRRRIDRRAGQPRKEHNTATCQACQENVCRMGQVLRKKMRTESTA